MGWFVKAPTWEVVELSWQVQWAKQLAVLKDPGANMLEKFLQDLAKLHEAAAKDGKFLQYACQAGDYSAKELKWYKLFAETKGLELRRFFRETGMEGHGYNEYFLTFDPVEV